MTTAAEFEALLTEDAEAELAYEAEAARDPWDVGSEAARERCRAAHDAVIQARPTDLASMAKQIRFVLDNGMPEDLMLAHIADQLEAMAADRDPPAPARAFEVTSVGRGADARP